jgi:hypothetical protein
MRGGNGYQEKLSPARRARLFLEIQPTVVDASLVSRNDQSASEVVTEKCVESFGTELKACC